MDVGFWDLLLVKNWGSCLGGVYRGSFGFIKGDKKIYYLV